MGLPSPWLHKRCHPGPPGTGPGGAGPPRADLSFEETCRSTQPFPVCWKRRRGHVAALFVNVPISHVNAGECFKSSEKTGKGKLRQLARNSIFSSLLDHFWRLRSALVLLVEELASCTLGRSHYSLPSALNIYKYIKITSSLQKPRPALLTVMSLCISLSGPCS